MISLDNSFNWKGLGVFVLAGAVCVFVVLVFRYGIPHAWSDFSGSNIESDATHITSEEAAPLHVSTTTVMALENSSTTPQPQRVINAITISQAIPAQGKFIVADLTNMKLTLYQNGTTTAEYQIITKGRVGTPWETPSGFYSIHSKEAKHFSTIGHVYMPYSMQFYGNYFIHGWTYYPDGTPVASSFTGGCIKLNTDDAGKVFAFADIGTKVFVYDNKQIIPPPQLTLENIPMPNIDAASYLVADIDTGDVYAEKDANVERPIASVTKLMTALTANEIIQLNMQVTMNEGGLSNPPNPASTTPKTFLVDDLFYPLLMQSSNAVAGSLASYYGTHGFIQWMNATAKSIGMASTTFADASGASPNNISTPEDLYHLAAYLYNKKSFVFKITQTQTKTITSDDGTSYQIKNVNTPANTAPFDGGKVGHTNAAQDTIVSVLALKVGNITRHVAIIVLDSDNQKLDTKHLADWITDATKSNSEQKQTACAGCSQKTQEYRKI